MADIQALAALLKERLLVMKSAHMEFLHFSKEKGSEATQSVENAPWAWTNQAIADVIQSGLPAQQQLEALRKEVIGDCQRCTLCAKRTQVVFGSGNPSAQLVFVGEAPGADEDMQGQPFVGRAGQLLTKMIQAMGYQRSDVYICNVVKCRPPNNREPTPFEVKSCEPFLKAQLAMIKPQVIVGLGRHACHCLLGVEVPMSQIRGQWAQYEGIDLMPTFHPAYLLRNPPKKREVWEDLQKVMERLKKGS